MHQVSVRLATISAFIFFLALTSNAIKSGEPIKDPAKARQRAQFLMRQFSIGSNGQLEGNNKPVKEILEEIVKTCPDTGEAGTAKVYLKYLERMDAVIKEKADPKGKPLFLGAILARQQTQAHELAEAQRSGNENISLQVKLDHFVERAKWKGNQVFGSAIVRQVSGSNLDLYFKLTELKGKKLTESLRYIWVSVDKDDPLLNSLRKGAVVQFQGVLDTHGYPRDQIKITGATLGAKK